MFTDAEYDIFQWPDEGERQRGVEHSKRATVMRKVRSLRLLFLRFLHDIVKGSAVDIACGEINGKFFDAHLVVRKFFNLRKVSGSGWEWGWARRGRRGRRTLVLFAGGRGHLEGCLTDGKA